MAAIDTQLRNGIVAFVLLALLPLLPINAYFEHMLALWAIYALLALSLNIVVGYLGELTFGHAAFFGIGAYTSVMLTMNADWPPALGPLAGAVVAGTFGLGIGAVSLRIAGPQFAILTLGFGAIIHTVTNYWVDFTRGPMGISNIPPLRLPGLAVDFSVAAPMYWLALALLAVLTLSLRALMRTRTGRAFLAVRENAQLAAAVGVNVYRTKLLGFIIATALAGFGGSLYGHYIKVITPDLMGLQYVAALIIMVIVGGKGTIAGPMLGAFVYVSLLEILRVTGPMRMVAFAALLTLCILFLPGGLISLGRRFAQRAGRKP